MVIKMGGKQVIQKSWCVLLTVMIFCICVIAQINTTQNKAIFILAPQSDDIAEAGLITLGNALAAEMASRWDGQILTWDDLARTMEYESHKMIIGCSDNACIAEYAGLVGCDYVLTTELTYFGSFLLFNMRIVDAVSMKTLRFISETTMDNPGILFERIGSILDRLFIDTLLSKEKIDSGIPQKNPVISKRKEVSRSLQKKMAFISGGSFTVCDTCTDKIEVNDFWIARKEITNKEYSECVTAGICTPAHYRDSLCDPVSKNFYNYNVYVYRKKFPVNVYERAGDPQFPVTCVSWEQARHFCSSWYGGRLPTIAEMTYATKAGGGKITYWGDRWIDHCNNENFEGSVVAKAYKKYRKLPRCLDTSSKCMPPGAMQPNAYGLYDMLGNVEEWVEDGRIRGVENESILLSLGRKNPQLFEDGSGYKTHFGAPWFTSHEDASNSWLGLSDLAHDGLGFRCVISGKVQK